MEERMSLVSTTGLKPQGRETRLTTGAQSPEACGGFKSVKGTPYRQHIFSLTANRPFIEATQEFLMNHCDLRRTRLRYYRNPEVATLTYGGRRQVSRIAAVLYRDATIYLPRKRVASLA
jgi:hypothetical protein